MASGNYIQSNARHYITFLLVIGLYLIPQFGFAQSNFDLKGWVFKQGSTDHLPFTNIVSLSKRTGTTSDDKGKFRIIASKGDTIAFSFVGYKSFKLVVTDSVISQRENLIITLEPMIYELSPVTVRNLRELPGFIRREAMGDTMQIRGIPYIDRGPYNPLSYYKTSLGFGNGGIALTGLLTALLSNFDKHYIQLRKLQEIEARDRQWFEEQKLYETKFNRELVASHTELKGPELDLFMEMYKPTPLFLYSANEYDITVYLKDSLENYKRFRRGQR
jgi:hypothetical protein